MCCHGPRIVLGRDSLTAFKDQTAFCASPSLTRAESARPYNLERYGVELIQVFVSSRSTAATRYAMLVVSTRSSAAKHPSPSIAL